MLHQLSGKVTGLSDGTSLVFASPDFRCEVDATGGRYVARLKPGRYAVCYRVFNNFMRLICEVDVAGSRELDIRYEVPSMTVKVHNLPPGTKDGMVYLRHPNGSFEGRRVDQLGHFKLDFERVPDLFVHTFDQIGIEVGGREHRFQFKAQIGGTIEIYFPIQNYRNEPPA